jgi:hypothetical protein
LITPPFERYPQPVATDKIYEEREKKRAKDASNIPNGTPA